MFPRFIHAILHVSTSFLSMAKYYSALLQGIFIQKDQIQVSCTAGGFFTVWDTREAHCMDRPHFVYPFICGVAFSLAIMNNAATNIHIQVLMWTYISLGLIPRSRNAGSNDKTLVAQRCPTLCDPMDCKPTRFPVHGILQARILEWVAILSSRGSSEPRDQTQLSHIAGSFFTIWATREAHIYIYTLQGHIGTLCLISWGTSRLYQDVTTLLHSRQVPISSCLQHLLLCVFSRIAMVTCCGFDFHFPGGQWHLFMCFTSRSVFPHKTF